MLIILTMKANRTVIDANHKGLSLNLKELSRYRDLFFVLAYRDFKVRYAQTFMGLLWVFIQPLLTLIIFTLVFTKVVNVDTGGVPYPLFAVCGMSAWTYFSYVLSQSGNSIIASQQMVKKIYFPRLIIPVSKAVVGLIDWGITFLFIIVLMTYYQVVPSSNIIFLPVFILLTVIASLSVGVWLSALTIRYRDFQYIVPFLVQFGLYVTPVGYPAHVMEDRIPDWAMMVYYLNPVAGIVEGFRWSILGGHPPNVYAVISLCVVLVLFISGLYYFKKVERVMADLV